MTNREAVIEEVQVSVYSEKAVDKALIDAELDPNGLYTPTNSKKVAIAALKVLRGLLSTKSITEGGFSITLQVEQRIASLAEDAGIIIETGKPTVTSRNVW